MELEFRHELEELINRHSMENGSDTPDFILCEYLMDCLAAFDRAVVAREKWYGRERRSVITTIIEENQCTIPKKKNS